MVIGNSRRKNYLNGHTIRYENAGASGTDTSNIIVAEELVKRGCEVVLITEELEEQLKTPEVLKNKPIGQKVNGVVYSDLNFTGITNREFDILVSNLWFEDYDSLPVNITKGLIYWCHMQWIYGIDKMLKYVDKHNLKLGVVNISNWEKKMNQNSLNHIKHTYGDFFNDTIPNPLMDDLINQVRELKIPKQKNKFIFHASWARGGDVAYRTVKELDLDGKELHAYDYLMTIHNYQDDFFKLKDSVDKFTLYKNIAESEYFLYPLYTPYQDVHKDTFSCVVAESIALGCVPITYPLGALPENFDGYCIWSDLPPNTNLNDIQEEPLTKDLVGVFNTTEYIKDAFLNSEDTIKTNIKNNGYDTMMRKFSSTMVGNKWNDLLKNFK